MDHKRRGEKKGPKIDFDLIMRTRLKARGESQTIIHCDYADSAKLAHEGWININPNTHLVNETGRQKVKMLFALNIPLAPAKFYFPRPGDKKRFTLVFQGIPESWVRFSLFENTEYGEGFAVRNIIKNKNGVYEITLN